MRAIKIRVSYFNNLLPLLSGRVLTEINLLKKEKYLFKNLVANKIFQYEIDMDPYICDKNIILKYTSY